MGGDGDFITIAGYSRTFPLPVRIDEVRDAANVVPAVLVRLAALIP